ncbi:MAG: response regulator receiver protein [Candidatus Magnetoglobus multicellularis str. Araruama]|uniref:Response regulator receiver protein n=1 Tax=Candidatus Magnetoglobus multicellularis str. Araruama TaxID=890399 RepID=A0A1V1PEF2_9BACT|nr:MAG: response regulator receiver protein [Candidatus Magnetoglobus multicellularis str. Araruama]
MVNDSLQNTFARKKASILIVDDTGLNIDILIGILKHYDVIPALSGKEALHIVLEEKVDLILLDIVMPEMDGFEVCRRLKADKRTKNIPVIIITVKNMEQDILRGYELGIVDYVAKPFNPVELLGKVKTHLELNACHLNIKTRLLCLANARDGRHRNYKNNQKEL